MPLFLIFMSLIFGFALGSESTNHPIDELCDEIVLLRSDTLSVGADFKICRDHIINLYFQED